MHILQFIKVISYNSKMEEATNLLWYQHLGDKRNFEHKDGCKGQICGGSISRFNFKVIIIIACFSWNSSLIGVKIDAGGVSSLSMWPLY